MNQHRQFDTVPYTSLIFFLKPPAGNKREQAATRRPMEVFTFIPVQPNPGTIGEIVSKLNTHPAIEIRQRIAAAATSRTVIRVV